jgi:hypothetical protein
MLRRRNDAKYGKNHRRQSRTPFGWYEKHSDFLRLYQGNGVAARYFAFLQLLVVKAVRDDV